jgi:hypothetical protein
VAKLLDVILPSIAVFLKIEILLEFLLATAKSGLPSPSKSAITIATGTEPVVKSILLAKLPDERLPLEDIFLKIEIVFAFAFATTKSVLPSPSKSPILMKMVMNLLLNLL